MNIINNSHPVKIVSGRIEVIFREVYAILEKELKRPPILGEKDIELRYDSSLGPIVYWPLLPEKYVVGLNVNGDYPSQIIYQIAHELCHLHIDPRINGLLIEIVCHKTAIDIVEMVNPRFLGQASTNEYINAIKRHSFGKYNIQDKVDLDWMRKTYREKAHKNDILDREFNDIVAFVLREQTDQYSKFGLIEHIRHSLSGPYEPDTNKLDAVNFYSLIDIEKLASNIGGDFGQTVRILLK